MLGPERPEAVSPERGVVLTDIHSHLLMVKNLSLSLFLSLSLTPPPRMRAQRNQMRVKRTRNAGAQTTNIEHKRQADAFHRSGGLCSSSRRHARCGRRRRKRSAVGNTWAGWGLIPVVFFAGMAGHPCVILRATSLSLQGDPANIGKV